MKDDVSGKILLCDCEGSQAVDMDALTSAGQECVGCYKALCTEQIDIVASHMQAGPITIACGQEAQVFADLAEDLNADAPNCVDIRDRAGWSDQGKSAGPKMAALLAQAAVDVRAAPVMDVMSQGVCLIIGAGDPAFALASEICAEMAVTVLQTDATSPPMSRDFDVVRGKLARVDGALGQFQISLRNVQMLNPVGRGDFVFTDPQSEAQSECDVVIDLTGGAAFVAAPHKRDGYLRADPSDAVALGKLPLAALSLIGLFEKPLYVRIEESLCAHSRAGQTGCSKCLNACPTGAISVAGDHVQIDPAICAGCGACASLCPSTAITYEDAQVSDLVQSLQVMARAFAAAGGEAPRLLVHDEWGGDMIRMAARHGRGLPADVVPFETSALGRFGHAEMLSALAFGFVSVDVLLARGSDRDTIAFEAALARAMAQNSDAVAMIDPEDPDAMADVLYRRSGGVTPRDPVLLLGNRRQIARVAAKTLNDDTDSPIQLPKGAPYGAVLVDTDTCTLCLSCVSLCPSGALADNPDLPQLRFQEDACLQCGICATICPENAIALQPQMDLRANALTQRVLNEEEPFHCVECGVAFGVKSTIEKITEKLAGVHAAFASSAQARMIQMCDDCRVQAQFHADDNPFAGSQRPRPRTSEDYYSDRKDH